MDKRKSTLFRSEGFHFNSSLHWPGLYGWTKKKGDIPHYSMAHSKKPTSIAGEKINPSVSCVSCFIKWSNSCHPINNHKFYLLSSINKPILYPGYPRSLWHEPQRVHWLCPMSLFVPNARNQLHSNYNTILTAASRGSMTCSLIQRRRFLCSHLATSRLPYYYYYCLWIMRGLLTSNCIIS